MTNKDIEDKIRACFKRTHMQTEGDMELFDTDLTVEELVKLFSQLENEARGCVDCKKLRCENCERLWQT